MSWEPWGLSGAVLTAWVGNKTEEGESGEASEESHTVVDMTGKA